MKGKISNTEVLAATDPPLQNAKENAFWLGHEKTAKSRKSAVSYTGPQMGDRL